MNIAGFLIPSNVELRSFGTKHTKELETTISSKGTSISEVLGGRCHLNYTRFSEIFL